MNAPALRFKEFTDPWRETSLGNVSNDVMYGMNAAAIPYDGINKYIRITDIDDASREFIPRPLSSPDGEIDDKFKLKNGDLVFARTGASVGKSYLYKEKDGNLLFAGFLVKFSIVRANPYFVYTHTLTSSYKRWLAVMSMRSGQPGVNAEELKEFKFLTPQFLEQTKIANFLTAVDEKISQLTQKHDLLNQYKKGVMQQIFSQELRFKDDDGGDFPVWEVHILGDLSDVRDGTHDSPKFYSSGYPLITSKNLLDSGRLDLENVSLISEEDFKKINKRSKVDCGDILFGMIGTIGNPVLVESSNFAIKNVALIKQQEKLQNNFLSQYLKSLAVLKQFGDITVGNTQKFIALGKLRQLRIQLPSKLEQTKIANFLNAIDAKISDSKAQLDALKQYKQGLLQQMFV